MLVTGSKNRKSDALKGLSIWLRQGGQSFYEPLPTTPHQQNVTVVIEGVDCATFPKALAESVDVNGLLTKAGINVGKEEDIVVWSDDGSICYALTVARKDADAVRSWAGKQTDVAFTTPLVASVRRAVVGGRHSKALALQFGREEVYAAFSVDGKLLFAEAVIASSDEELLNFLAVLNGDFDLRKADIFIAGVDAKKRTKMLGRYFRRCRCEKEWAVVYNK